MSDATFMSSSVLAVVTTVHAVLFLLRAHSEVRGAWLLASPSALFAMLAWAEPSGTWVLSGLAAGVVCFVLSGALAKPRKPEALAAAEAAHKFVPLRVVETRDECSTIRTLRLSRPPGFDFDAGQFLTVQVDVGGRQHVRCYSISSAPGNRDYLEISVRRQGLVSGLLHATARPGTALLARKPAGRFVYPADENGPLVLLAGGIGITPLIAMARHAVVADPARRVTLIYSVRHAGDIAFQEELARLEQAHTALRVVITVTGGADAPGVRKGRIDAGTIRQEVEDPTAAVYMICGPLSMIDASRTILDGLGVPAVRIRYEAFEAAAAAGAKVPGGAGGQKSTNLRLARSQVETTVTPGESLLEAAEKAGVDLPSVCRSGVCGTCRTRLVTGRAQCTSQTLAQVERENGFVLPCVTWADDDCTLDA